MQGENRLKQKLILAGLIVLTLGLRLWRIEGYMMFLGDEGRDVMVVRRILQGKLTLLGPTASVGGFYLGPIYYYFMAPFLWLLRMNPVGPAVLVVLFHSLTVGLLFLFASRFLNWRVGLVAGLIYALSPLTIRYGQSSWNPNPLPLFSMVLVASLVWALEKESWWPVMVAGWSLGVALQLHYLALILGPIGLVFIFLDFKRPLLFKRILGFFFGWLLGFSFFVLFELRHGFPNTKTILRFLTPGEGTPVGGSVVELVSRLDDLASRLGGWFLGYPFEADVKYLVYVATAFSLILLLTLSVKRRQDKLGILAVNLWWFLGLMGLALYQGQVHDYYFAFLFPAFALILGIFFGRLLSWFPINIFAFGGLAYLVGHLIAVSPLWRQPNFQLRQTHEIAEAVVNRLHGDDYNFALIAEHNSDHAYRYFLEVWGETPKALEDGVTDQLMVVCEEKECSVLGHSLWEIAGFGRAILVGAWEVKGGVKIYQLVHHPESIHLVGKPAVKG